MLCLHVFKVDGNSTEMQKTETEMYPINVLIKRKLDVSMILRLTEI